MCKLPSIIVRIFAGTLIAAVFTMIPAISASASASVSVEWVTSYSTNTLTYSCNSGTHTYYGETINYVSNGCKYRVWLHEYTNGSGNSYCINPGARAYGFNGTYQQFQVTTNPDACDYQDYVLAGWAGFYTNYNCVDGATYTFEDSIGDSYFLNEIDNACNVRIWAHQNTDGSGATLCISPGEVLQDIELDYYPYRFYQFQISGNQAPCSAG